jgi:hypothetical protein
MKTLLESILGSSNTGMQAAIQQWIDNHKLQDYTTIENGKYIKFSKSLVVFDYHIPSELQPSGGPLYDINDNRYIKFANDNDLTLSLSLYNNIIGYSFLPDKLDNLDIEDPVEISNVNVELRHKFSVVHDSFSPGLSIKPVEIKNSNIVFSGDNGLFEFDSNIIKNFKQAAKNIKNISYIEVNLLRGSYNANKYGKLLYNIMHDNNIFDFGIDYKPAENTYDILCKVFTKEIVDSVKEINFKIEDKQSSVLSFINKGNREYIIRYYSKYDYMVHKEKLDIL